MVWFSFLLIRVCENGLFIGWYSIFINDSVVFFFVFQVSSKGPNGWTMYPNATVRLYIFDLLIVNFISNIKPHTHVMTSLSVTLKLKTSPHTYTNRSAVYVPPERESLIVKNSSLYLSGPQKRETRKKSRRIVALCMCVYMTIHIRCCEQLLSLLLLFFSSPANRTSIRSSVSVRVTNTARATRRVCVCVCIRRYV